MVYAGTAVSYGRGRRSSWLRGWARSSARSLACWQGVESRRTPLQQNLDRVGHILARAALAVVALIVVLGLLRGQPFWEMVIFGIALAVAVVPEALPAVVTISLALGAQRMVKRNALVRRLSAVETLGSVSVIASDKTGTLTKGEMTIRQIYAGGRMLEVTGAGYEPIGEFLEAGAPVTPPAVVLTLLRGAALASDARLKRQQACQPTGRRARPPRGTRPSWPSSWRRRRPACTSTTSTLPIPRVAEIPFTSETKRMTTLHRTPEGVVAYSKGAPEVILAGCSRLLDDDGARIVGRADRERVLDASRNMASQALRVLAVAVKPRASLEDAERGMTFLGLVGMSDPPRPEAGRAIETCVQAGIKPILITGDHVLTAEAVARELGVLKQGRVVTGAELDAMSDEELQRQVAEIEVYARVSPAHKLRVVTAWQSKGHFVAMTGDGVNDAPALKKADIGVAMGITGTDVTKEAAAMTLTDDNFASIVAAVEEGRGVFSNIKKYLMYLLSSNVGEIGLMAGASLLGMPLPLTAVQILYVNLATDGLPALALAVDPPEADLMRRPPRDPRAGIFTRPVLTLTLLGGAWSMLVNIGLFAWALGSGRGVAEAVTMTFVSLVLIQFFKAYNFRSDRHSVLVRPVRQQVAEPRHRLGARRSRADHLLARAQRAVRDVPAAPHGLGHRDGRGFHGVPGPRACEVDGAAGLVREPQLVTRSRGSLRAAVDWAARAHGVRGARLHGWIERLRQRIEERVSSHIGQMDVTLGEVEVSVTALPGSRFRCRMRARPLAWATVVVDEEDVDVHVAVDRASSRLAGTIRVMRRIPTNQSSRGQAEAEAQAATRVAYAGATGGSTASG